MDYDVSDTINLKGTKIWKFWASVLNHQLQIQNTPKESPLHPEKV